MKFKHALAAIIAAVTLAGTAACEVPDDSGTAADRTNPKGAATKDAKTKDDASKPAKPGKTKPAAPKETAGEAQAREKAADYLDYTSFSRTGLIKQLQYDGFNVKDATYGTDAQHADWNKQAAAKAADYLDYTSFSRSGLIQQLKYDGFTEAQAEYGVNKVGL